MSPVSRVYKAGSIIYFAGDRAETVFVLQNGILTLSYLSPEGNELSDTIQSGEFFGVKSALGGFPREETVSVNTDAAVMVLSTKEFMTLAMNNHKLVMKMLNVFSRQLRRIGHSIQERMGQDQDDDGAGLFDIGEYYLRNKKFDQALYAYERFLEYYPDSELSAECRDRLEKAKNGVATGYAVSGDGFTQVADKKQHSEPSSDDDIPSAVDPDSLAKSYYDNYALFSQGQYSEAMQGYRSLHRNYDQLSAELQEKLLFDMGRCAVQTEDYQEGIDILTDMIKQFPSSKLIRQALFFIGNGHRGLNDTAKAAGFLRKVISMEPKDGVTKKAERALKELGA